MRLIILLTLSLLSIGSNSEVEFPSDVVLKSLILDQSEFVNDNKDEVVVTEFFYYGCIHCYNIEPKIKKWLKRKPKYIRFERVPAAFKNTERAAKIYYVAKKLGVEEKFTERFFDLVVKKGAKLSYKNAVSVMVGLGIRESEFYKALGSFYVKSKLARAKNLVSAIKYESVPTFTINYKYMTDNGLAEASKSNPNAVFDVIEKLAEYEYKKGQAN